MEALVYPLELFRILASTHFVIKVDTYKSLHFFENRILNFLKIILLQELLLL